jgi:hypothetical protein
MKKFGIGIVLLVLGAAVFAFENRGEADITEDPGLPPAHYYFYSFDFNGAPDLLLFGVVMGSEGLNPAPAGYIVNNTELSPALKAKMRELKANACVTRADGSVYINVHLPKGTYATIVYTAKKN